jgi:rhodanese-related sulfurtransferase
MARQCRPARPVALLQKMGYTHVVSMDGGIRDWREQKYPLTSG